MIRPVLLLLLLAQLAAAQPIPGGRSFDLDPTDAAYDRSSGKLYVLSRSGSLSRMNSAGPSIEQTTTLPVAAQSIVLTEDGRKLYALAVAFPSTVVRLDTATLTVEAQYILDTVNIPNCFCRVTQVLPVAGQERALVGLISAGTRLEAVAVFDEDRRRPKTVGKAPAFFDISTLVAGPAPDLVYGYNGVTDGWGLTRMRVTDEGIESLGHPVVTPSGFNRALAVSRGLLYAANGSIHDVERDVDVGRFDEVIFSNVLAIDEEAERIYFATRTGVSIGYTSSDIKTMLPAASLWVDNQDAKNLAMPFAPKRMLLTNERDLVVFDGERSQLVFVPTAALRPYDVYEIPPVQRLTAHLGYLAAPAAFLAADAVNQRLYFTMLGHLPGIGNSVTALDPKSGWMSEPVFAGSDPGPLAVSATGRYVYSSILGEHSVRRLSVPGLKTELAIRPMRSGLVARGRPATTTQILPLPDRDESVVLIHGGLDGPDAVSYDSTTIWDGDVRRPRIVAEDFDGDITSAALSADGTRVWGLEGSTSSFEFTQLRVQPDGVAMDRVTRGIGSDFKERLSCDDTLCATSAGTVLDAPSATRLARLPRVGQVLVDRMKGTVYVLRQAGAASALLEYDIRTAQLLRQMALPMPGPFWCLVRWSGDQFAVLSEDGLWLISAAGMTAPPPTPEPRVTTNTSGFLLELGVTSMAYDRSRGLLYAAVPGGSAAYGDQIVAIDPKTGKVVKALAAGSGPALLRVSDDGKYLYSGLQTANRVVRIDLAEWRVEATFPTAGSPSTLAVRPGNSRSFAVSLGPGAPRGFGTLDQFEHGLWLYEDGQRLPSPAFPNGGPSWAYFVDGNTLAAESQIVRVTANGFTEEPRRVPLFRAASAAGGRLFGGGSIHDAASLEPLHELNETGAELPVPEQNRIYYLHLGWDRSKSAEIRVYEWTTLRAIGTIPFARDDAPSEMVSCGEDCIAVRSNLGVSIVSTAAIQWSSKERPATTDGDGWRMPLRVNRLVFDARRNRLLATTTPENGYQGNSLLTIRSSDGVIEQSVLAGTDPGPIAVSDTGRVYAGLRGERAIAEIERDTGTSRKIATIPRRSVDDEAMPEGLAWRPGTVDTLAVSLGESPGDGRVALFEGGRMLPGVAENVFDTPRGQDVYFTPDGARVQVVETPNGSGTWSLPVGSGGVTWAPRMTAVYGTMVARCGDRLYDVSGGSFDVRTFERLGGYALSERAGPGLVEGVACDEQRDRVHYMVRGSTILTYRMSTGEFAGSTQGPRRAGVVYRMASAGDAGVAYWISEPDYGQTTRAADELIVVKTP